MPSPRPLAAASLLALALLAAPLGAQQGDSAASLPFRRGQWAVQFSPAASLVSFGALRFRTPTRAWVLDVGGTVRAGRTEEENIANGTTRSSDDQVVSTQLQLGTRHFRPVTARINAYGGVGLVGTVDVTTRVFDQVPPLGSDAESTRLEGGVYGELGGNWMITSHLALGARTQLRAGYYRSTVEYDLPGTVVEVRQRGGVLSFGGAQVLATLFF